MTRGSSIVAVIAVFLLGLLAGVFSAHLYYAHSVEARARRGGPPGPGGFVQRLQTELELDAEQARQVGEILRRSHRDAETLRRELEPRVRAHARATHEQIAAILNEDQRRRFERMMRGMERRAERYMLGPPGGRPRRHRTGAEERGGPRPAEPQPE